MITHVVLMKLREVKDAELVTEQVLSLRNKIPGLMSIDGGAGLLSTPVAWDMGFVMIFDHLDTVTSYQSHPAHLAVGEVIRGLLSEMATCDLETHKTVGKTLLESTRVVRQGT